MPWPERIVVDPQLLAGKPVIRGTRLAVEFILELLAAGQQADKSRVSDLRVGQVFQPASRFPIGVMRGFQTRAQDTILPHWSQSKSGNFVISSGGTGSSGRPAFFQARKPPFMTATRTPFP